MSNNQIEVIECVIRAEIKEWFKKFINETCGLDVQIRYQSNGGHFNTHIKVEISGRKSQINQAIEIIGIASEKTRYTLPWVNETTYYVRTIERREEMVRNELNLLKNTDSDFNYVNTTNNIIGIGFVSFSFRSSISQTSKIQIEEIFKRLALHPIAFIIYPKIRATHTQPSNDMTTNILTAFHGEFLSYLDLEDILSLELANNGRDGSCYDTALDHDIQKYLREKYPEFYTGVKIGISDLKHFKNNDLLCYFIEKYQGSLKKIGVPDILTADEIQRLKCLPNIVIKSHNIIHIDFKPTNNLEPVDFCVTYHFDSNRTTFLKYDPTYATENYSIHFHDDCSLEPLQCNTEFWFLILKSQINCSPQKSNAVLQYLAKYFKAYQNRPILILYQFDLNHVSNETISSLLFMMRQGTIEFHEMSFNIKTLITILNQCNQNKFVFKKCFFAYANLEVMSKNSRVECLEFSEMEIDLNILGVLKNIELLVIHNCRIVRPSSIVPINMEDVNQVQISLTSLDLTTTRKLMDGLQRAEIISFVSCDLTPNNYSEGRCFTVRNGIVFENMNFEIRTLFQMFENCEIQNLLKFKSCDFHLENIELNQFSLKPMNLIFECIKFKSITLLTIIKTLHKESKVTLKNCRILPLDENPDIAMDLIQLRYVHLYNCYLQTHTLLNMLSKISSKVNVLISDCDLMHSSAKYSNILTNLSKISFHCTKISSQNLMSILGILKRNASVSFDCCEITGEEFPKINLQKGITIYFGNMTVPSCIARSLIQNDCTVHFDNFTWDFMTKVLSNISIQSNVILRNMKFEFYNYLKSLVKLFTQSKLTFITCDFGFKSFSYPCILEKPFPISFHKTSIDLDVLVTIIEIISDQIRESNEACNSNQVPSRRPIKISNMSLEWMHLEIEAILSVLKNCTSLSQLVVNNCIIVCSNPMELLSDNLKYRIPRLPLDVNPFIKKSIKSYNINAVLRNLSDLVNACIPDLRNLMDQLFSSETNLPEIRLNRTKINTQDLFNLLDILKVTPSICFSNCEITNISNIVIKPTLECLKIQFKDVTLTVRKILYFLNNFSNLIHIGFENCKIMWSDPNELLITTLKVSSIHFCNMDVDVEIFNTFVKNCIKGAKVTVTNCEIIPARNKMFSYISMEIGYLVLKDVTYSPELLQIFQNLNTQCKIDYDGQLTNEAIIEICIKSSVHGERLKLSTQNCTESIYFELFAEFFGPFALNFECDPQAEYDLPTYLIPDIPSLYDNSSKYNWDQFKIKFVSVNVVTMKLEFLKNGKVIDLFHELNNLLDFEECVVDYS